WSARVLLLADGPRRAFVHPSHPPDARTVPRDGADLHPEVDVALPGRRPRGRAPPPPPLGRAPPAARRSTLPVRGFDPARLLVDLPPVGVETPPQVAVTPCPEGSKPRRGWGGTAAARAREKDRGPCRSGSPPF